VQALIERLGLIPHPEGGFYRETWRSPVLLSASSLPVGYPGDRSALTSIYFLLPTGVRSQLHRVRSEELWLHHQGDDLRLGIGATQEAASDPEGWVRLGQAEPAVLQAIVPAGHWQEALALPGPFGFVLVGCVVAPGFDFEDFELAG
jgi:predicted cupin superfamily sugar epimerase